MEEENVKTPPEEWLTCELFDYCQLIDIISPDEDFEDWKNCRTDLLQMVKDDIGE